MAWPTAMMSLKYTAPTGFGSFRLEFTPSVPRLTVKVKVHWEWIDASGSGRSSSDQQSCRRWFEQEAQQAWRKRWKFRCSAPGHELEVAPSFQITRGTATDHQFMFKVKNVRRRS